jgi:hypothetical protein
VQALQPTAMLCNDSTHEVASDRPTLGARSAIRRAVLYCSVGYQACESAISFFQVRTFPHLNSFNLFFIHLEMCLLCFISAGSLSAGHLRLGRAAV